MGPGVNTRASTCLCTGIKKMPSAVFGFDDTSCVGRIVHGGLGSVRMVCRAYYNERHPSHVAFWNSRFILVILGAWQNWDLSLALPISSSLLLAFWSLVFTSVPASSRESIRANGRLLVVCGGTWATTRPATASKKRCYRLRSETHVPLPSLSASSSEYLPCHGNTSGTFSAEGIFMQASCLYAPAVTAG